MLGISNGKSSRGSFLVSLITSPILALPATHFLFRKACFSLNSNAQSYVDTQGLTSALAVYPIGIVTTTETSEQNAFSDYFWEYLAIFPPPHNLRENDFRAGVHNYGTTTNMTQSSLLHVLLAPLLNPWLIIAAPSEKSHPSHKIALCTYKLISRRPDLELSYRLCLPQGIPIAPMGMFVRPPFALFSLVEVPYEVSPCLDQDNIIQAWSVHALNRPSIKSYKQPTKAAQSINGTYTWR